MENESRVHAGMLSSLNCWTRNSAALAALAACLSCHSQQPRLVLFVFCGIVSVGVADGESFCRSGCSVSEIPTC